MANKKIRMNEKNANGSYDILHPETTIEQVIDPSTGQNIKEHFLDTTKKHIEIVDEIPTNLAGKGVFFRRQNETPNSPNKPSIQDLEDQLNSHESKIATTSQLGHVKPDGTTIVIDSNGVISSISADTTIEEHIHPISQIAGLDTALNSKAPLSSPTFTGTPIAPTASDSTNNTQIATTAFVKTAINAITGTLSALTTSVKTTIVDSVNSLKALIDSHMSNEYVHTTPTEKTTWNGKYTKPINGIPKSDLSSDVQASLEKADNALQSIVVDNHMNDLTMHVRYGVTNGSANTYTVNMTGVSSYVDGLAVAIKILTTNTGSSTLNINYLGAKTIYKANGSTLSSGNLRSGSIYTLRYNGTNFILQAEGSGGGNATTSDVLTGKTFTNDTGELTGTMVNRGAQALTPSISRVTIPAGYHNGSGYVSAISPQFYNTTVSKTFTRVLENNDILLSMPSTTIYPGFKPLVVAMDVQMPFVKNGGYEINMDVILVFDFYNEYPVESNFFRGTSNVGNFWYNGSDFSFTNSSFTVSNLAFMGQDWSSGYSITKSIKFRVWGV